MQERDTISIEQRAIDLAGQVMTARVEKNKEKFPAESTREEIIAAAFLRQVHNK